MKNLGFIAVLALFMLFGCSKDDLINTDQELFSVEKNAQTGIGAKRGDGGINGWNFVEFYGTSMGTESLTICLPDSFTGLPLDCGRKLLTNGYFSGNLSGYGKINSSFSKYSIAFREEPSYWELFPYYQDDWYYGLYNDPTLTDRFEEFQYKIVITGQVGTSNKDYFNIEIIAVIRPMIDDVTGDIIKGSWIVTSDIVFKSGLGKLANYSDEYFTCGTRLIEGTNYSGVNLATGEMSLVLHNIHF